jgi:hypothetical protein
MKYILLNFRYLARKLHVVTFQENVILVQVHRCVYSKRGGGMLLYFVVIFALKISNFRNVDVEFCEFSDETANSKHRVKVCETIC